MENKWISVSKAMPKEDTPVLVFQPNEREELEMFVCSQHDGIWREYCIDNSGDMYESLTWYDEITHWMPLPTNP